MVTGRQLEDLQKTFSRLDLFDRVVAENGALLFRPESREEKILGAAPPQAFLDALASAAFPFPSAALSSPHGNLIKRPYLT